MCSSCVWVPQILTRPLSIDLVLGEDVEDHRGAVQGAATEDLLQIELLSRAQLVVEDHGVAVDALGDLLDLRGLARADEGGRIG